MYFVTLSRQPVVAVGELESSEELQRFLIPYFRNHLTGTLDFLAPDEDRRKNQVGGSQGYRSIGRLTPVRAS